MPDVVTLRVWWTRSPLVISTVRTVGDTSANTSLTWGSRWTSSSSIERPRSTSSPTTALGIIPSVTEIAARTIDSVNAFTPYPVTEMSARSTATSAAWTSIPSGTCGPTSSTKRRSAWRNESSLRHKVSSASNATTSNRSMRRDAARSAEDCIEIVVHRDAAHAHCVGHVLDGTAQDERTALVEQTHRSLLVLARQSRQPIAEFGLDRIDQPVE